MSYFMCAVMLIFFQHTYSFQTLKEAQIYAQAHPEFPQSDTDDFEKPDFRSFYAQNVPWWNRILMKFGIGTQRWSPTDILPQLLRVSHMRTDHPVHARLSVTAGSRFVIFGNLFGAFHSLIRDLTHLKEQEIIDDHFKIKDPQTYIVCLGNAIDFSAYSLETLSILLTLIQANPQSVFYLRATHESKMRWHHFGLMHELQERLSGEVENGVRLLNTFFEQLPVDLIVRIQGGNQDFFLGEQLPEKSSIEVFITGGKFINYGQGQGLYRERTPNRIIWTVVSSPVKLFRNKYDFFYDAYVLARVESTLEKSTLSLFYSDGKGEFKRGATRNLLTGVLIERGVQPPAPTSAAPALLSLEQLTDHVTMLKSQVKLLREQFELIKSQVHPSHLQIHSRSAHTPLINKLQQEMPLNTSELNQAAFDTEQNYNALASEIDDLADIAQKKGLTLVKEVARRDESIRLGSTLDLTKSVRGLGIPFREGLALKVNRQNQEGGIQGKPVQIVFLDDGYTPALSRKNVDTLLREYHTPYLICPIGTPTLLASMDLIQKKEILVLFPQSGSTAFRKPELTHIINFRASFEDEGRLLTEYVIKTFLLKNFVFFYQDDAFGLSIMKGAKEALKEAHIGSSTEVSYLANTSLFKDAAQKIRAANPDVIGFFATGPATLQLIRDIGVEFLANKTLYAVSSVGDEATLKVLKEKGLKVIFGQLVPNPQTSTLEIVKEYRREIGKAGESENVFSLEAYIAASITFDQISKIKGTLTMQSLIKQMESIKDYRFKGLSLNFNPETRSLAKYLWIDTGAGTWIQKKITKK
jgi:branched-chain amino acid transport system substrate-binding protein